MTTKKESSEADMVSLLRSASSILCVKDIWLPDMSCTVWRSEFSVTVYMWL
jgi:hypothetical protein